MRGSWMGKKLKPSENKLKKKLSVLYGQNFGTNRRQYLRSSFYIYYIIGRKALQ